MENNKYKINDLIKKRWSPRSFSEKSIENNILLSIFEAARWAPSSMNEQPWIYYYAKKSEAGFEKILNCLVPANIIWAKNADVLIISTANKKYKRGNSPNRHYMYDTGSANQNLLLQALEYDIFGHPMGGFDIEKTKNLLSLTEEIEPVCIIALGYLDKPEKLEEPHRQRETAERKRKPLEEIINKV
ncbi:MAG: nitroreductase family protein [bacterium]